MISLALLSYFTIDFLLEAIENINHVECICDGPDDEDNCHLKDSDETCEAEDDVNAYIVLGFALGGLLFDVISLWAYKHYASDGSSEDEDNEHPHHHHLDDHPLSHRHHDEEDAAARKNRPNVNMLSALMHVFSDLLRSTTTFVESIVLFQYPDIDSVVVDGWAALIVCSLIAIGAVWSLGIWVGEVYTYCTGDDDDEEDNDMKKKFIDHV
jgi:Co/Zn/Cd efflux system component